MANILEEITSASLRFLAPLTPEKTYEIIVDEAVRLVRAEYGSIVLEQNGELARIYSSSQKAFNTKYRKRGNTFEAFKKRKVLIVDISDIESIHPELRDYGIKTSVFIPLSYENKSLGVLTVNSQYEIKHTADELKILKLFGAMASLAIRKTQLYDETKRALEVRDRFISLASHELRTPLTSLNGYIQLLAKKMEGKESTEASYVRELQIESNRMTYLVKELLEINRIKQGQLSITFQEAGLVEILKKSIKLFTDSHPNRKIIFTTPILSGKDFVVGDPDKLVNVFSGIIQNAIKFSPEKSEIIIKLKTDKTHFIIDITDEGKGIASNDLDHVLEGFHKGEDNFNEGMGVGLLLAKHTLELHKGSIVVDSEEGKGTTVELRIPRIKR